MAIQIATNTGPQYNADGANTDILRTSRNGGLVVQDEHAKFYEAVARGNMFSAHNTAAQAVSVALATTYTGLCLSNPLGSGKNLVLVGANYALSVAPAAIASLHLIGGYSSTTDVTHTTPLASPGIRSNIIGSPAYNSIAKVDSAATLVGTIGYLLPVANGFTAAALPNQTPLYMNLDGIFIVPPGGYVAWGALTAVTGFGFFTWEEVAI